MAKNTVSSNRNFIYVAFVDGSGTSLLASKVSTPSRPNTLSRFTPIIYVELHNPDGSKVIT